MGLSSFIMMYNASQSGSLQPPPPQGTGIIYVSVTGTGNGLSQASPMSVEDFDALAQEDNRTVRFFANEVI